MSEEGWGGGLRHLHWITADGALCNPKMALLRPVEWDAIGEYILDHACRRCWARLVARDLEEDP